MTAPRPFVDRLGRVLLRRIRRRVRDDPIAALRRAERVGCRLRTPTDVRPDPDALAALARALDVDPFAMARSMHGMHAVTEVLRHAVRRGWLDALAPAMRWRGGQRLVDLRARGRPFVCAAWHHGPYTLPPPAFVALGIPAAFMTGHRKSLTLPEGWSVHDVRGGEIARLGFLQAALGAVAGGGTAVVTIDGPFGATLDVSLLGGTIPLGRGLPTLSRMAGAEIVPLTLRWSAADGLSVEVHEPLPPVTGAGEEAERAALTALAARYEASLRADPGALSPYAVRWLTGAVGRAPHP